VSSLRTEELIIRQCNHGYHQISCVDKEPTCLLSWASILYGAALSAVVAAAALAALARPRQATVIVAGVLATAAGPIAWNAVLRATHASQFFTDAPVAVLPASWQDTGSGVFALAATAVLLSVGPLAATPARRTIGRATACGPAAFLVDVYLY
jgi:hypothetical protein